MLRELIVKEDPKSPISEIFRTLRTNIQFMNTKNKLQSLLITSTIPGEGKSWISANLGITFAQTGKRVIVLDADMRKGRQYSIFDVPAKPGLSNFLSIEDYNDDKVDLADYIQETEIENLYVVPAGDVPPNPSELLVSENMLTLIEKLKNICDIVIIDGPPTQLVTDSLILARIADSTVIIAESNKTKKENLKRIVNNIQKVGGKIAGVVINKMPLSTKKYDQSYYYGSTAMTISDKKVKNRKSKEKVSKEEIIQETKNRNNERVKQLVNQNRIKKEDLNKQVENNKEDNKDDNKEDNEKIKNKYELDEKTKEILKQVNEYLENNKNN